MANVARVRPLGVVKRPSWLASDALSVALVPAGIVVASRFALGVVVWIGQMLFPINPMSGKWFALPNALALDPWVRWDSGWYLLAAQNGYQPRPGSPESTPP